MSVAEIYDSEFRFRELKWDLEVSNVHTLWSEYRGRRADVSK